MPLESQDDCLICLETLKDPVQLPCHHQFCSSCLNQWRCKYDIQSSQKTCPKCRQNIPPTRQMIQQVKIHKRRLADLKERLNSPEPFVFEKATERGVWGGLSVDPSEIQAISEAPIEEHDTMFRDCFERLAQDLEDFINDAEEQIGDYDQVLAESSDEGMRLPSEIYDAAGFEYDDLPKVFEWLGPSPIPKERINAKNPDHMDNTLLHLAVKMSDIGLVSFLLQNGADVHSEMFVGATPIETVAHRLEFDEVSRLLLEWGARKESNLVDLAQMAEQDGNLKLAHLLRTTLGGRRCEIIGLAKRSDLNGKCGIAGRYVKNKGRYVVSLEGTKEDVLIRPTNLKRRDRTPEDCGAVFQYNAETDSFSKKFVGP